MAIAKKPAKRSAVAILKSLEKPVANKIIKKTTVKKVVSTLIKKDAFSRELSLIFKALNSQKYNKTRFEEIVGYTRGMIMGAHIIGGLSAIEKTSYIAQLNLIKRI